MKWLENLSVVGSLMIGALIGACLVFVWTWLK